MVHISVEPAEDLGEYLSTWKSAIEGHYWATEHHIMDFNIPEEVEEISADWETDESQFLVARNSGGTAVGVIGYKYRDYRAQIRRWEPAVLDALDANQISKILLDAALAKIQSHGCSYVIHRMKHPYGQPDTIKSFFELYSAAGFFRGIPDGVGMLSHVDELEFDDVSKPGFDVRYARNFSESRLVSLIVESYTGTEEDMGIHIHDESVTEPDSVLSSLRWLRGGGFGRTTPRLWKVASVDGNPVGLVGAFIIEKENYKVAILGPVCVMVSHRRQGIAKQLLLLEMRDLHDMGCEICYVGTPHNNKRAIRLYQDVGFDLVDRQLLLRKDFD